MHIYIYRQYIVLSYFIWSDHLVFYLEYLFTFNVVVHIVEIKCTCQLFVIPFFFVPILIFEFILLFYFKYAIGLLIISDF